MNKNFEVYCREFSQVIQCDSIVSAIILFRKENPDKEVITVENIEARIESESPSKKEDEIISDETTTPQSIVDENFKGLDDLIEDKDLCQWYKDLIVTCLEDWGKYNKQSQPRMNPNNSIQ